MDHEEHSRSAHDPLMIHSRSTQDPLKIRSRSTQDPLKNHARFTQDSNKIHSRSTQDQTHDNPHRSTLRNHNAFLFASTKQVIDAACAIKANTLTTPAHGVNIAPQAAMCTNCATCCNVLGATGCHGSWFKSWRHRLS